MTATPERPTSAAPHADSDEGATDWANRSLFDTQGIPWWWAVLLAVVPTALGTLVDVLVWSKPGLVFTCCYALGSLLAVALVRRTSLFGPMVQPPLVLAIIMPLVVLAIGADVPSNAGTTATVLAVASPLINGFPAMAITTALAIAIGLLRMFVLERYRPREPKIPVEDSDAPTKKAPRPVGQKPPEAGRRPPEDKQRSAAARGEGRRRPASGPESGQRSARGARTSGRGRPAEGGEPAKPAANKKRPKPAAERQEAKQDGAPAKRGSRARGSSQGGEQQRGAQQGKRQGGQPGRPAPGSRPRGEGKDKPQRNEQPPPGRGAGQQRQAPPGRGGKPPQRPSGDQPGRPRRPRRDNG